MWGLYFINNYVFRHVLREMSSVLYHACVFSRFYFCAPVLESVFVHWASRVCVHGVNIYKPIYRPIYMYAYGFVRCTMKNSWLRVLIY